MKLRTRLSIAIIGILILAGGGLATAVIRSSAASMPPQVDLSPPIRAHLGTVADASQLTSAGGTAESSSAGTADIAGRNRAEAPSTGQDVQSGHQTGSATSGADREQASEAEGEKDAEQADREGDVHEDPPGQDVEHECPPNCDTANGEKP